MARTDEARWGSVARGMARSGLAWQRTARRGPARLGVAPVVIERVVREHEGRTRHVLWATGSGDSFHRRLTVIVLDERGNGGKKLLPHFALPVTDYRII